MTNNKKFYQCLTDFIFTEQEPQQADIIFVPGGNYPDAARNAARLYREGYAPYVMPSGRYSIVTGKFVCPDAEEPRDEKRNKSINTDTANNEMRRPCLNNTDEKKPDVLGEGQKKQQDFETECDYLCDILLCGGVPETAILCEDQATYTYENAIYSRKLADRFGLSVKKAILSCQAFHARRSLMYYQEQFPETEFLVCPVVTKGISRENWFLTEYGIDTVLGEVERCGAQFHEIMRMHLNCK